MQALEYFEVESTEPAGGEMYRRIAEVVLLDHDLLKVVSKFRAFIDPEVPVFIATGIAKKVPALVRVRDFANVNIQDRQVILALASENYLAPLLKILWERFGKDRVDQPDRFTITMELDPSESGMLEDMVVLDPGEALHRDLIYALQCIAPEGFKVRRQFYGKGVFWYVASENTLAEDIVRTMVAESFHKMGESL
jgi:putative methanogenesis marker protein 17